MQEKSFSENPEHNSEQPGNTVSLKLSEKALIESEEEYKTLVENLSVGVYRNTGGPHGQFIQANTAIVKIFGYDSVEEFMKVSVSDLYMRSEDRKSFIEEVKQKGFVKGKELQLKKKDGTPMWGSCTATIKYDENGNIRWIDGIIEDISDRKKTEDMLQHTNEILSNILSASPIGIGLIENDLISWANHEMIKMFGFRDKENYTKKSIKIIYASESEYERVACIINDKIRKGGDIVDVEASFRRSDGTTFTGHFKLSSPDPLNVSKKAIFTIHDISWRIKSEKEKMQKEKLQGVLEMAGAICHEMNQPIQTISTYLEILLSENKEKTGLHDKIEKITSQIERLKMITKKLSGITRYETLDYPSGIKIIDIHKSSRAE
ncbi:MAG: PAS domain S-box protein [Desulfobacteraceae bacterium]|nr:MAG: PAS domain S-box protein [Desulfobacteraceae bacterium]